MRLIWHLSSSSPTSRSSTTPRKSASSKDCQMSVIKVTSDSLRLRLTTKTKSCSNRKRPRRFKTSSTKRCSNCLTRSTRLLIRKIARSLSWPNSWRLMTSNCLKRLKLWINSRSTTRSKLINSTRRITSSVESWLRRMRLGLKNWPSSKDKRSLLRTRSSLSATLWSKRRKS